MARVEDDPGYTNSRTTGEGAPPPYRVEHLPIGAQQRTVTAYPDGPLRQKLSQTNGRPSRTAADGTVTVSCGRSRSPLRHGGTPLLQRHSATPGGVALTVESQRTANLTDRTIPLSLTTLTDTLIVNGRTSTSVYDAATRTTTSTTQAGRRATETIDTQGRPTRFEVAGLVACQPHLR